MKKQTRHTEKIIFFGFLIFWVVLGMSSAQAASIQPKTMKAKNQSNFWTLIYRKAGSHWASESGKLVNKKNFVRKKIMRTMAGVGEISSGTAGTVGNPFGAGISTFDIISSNNGKIGSALTTSNPTNTGSPNASTVPIPAAVWLFGSALVGMVSTGRRKRQAS